MNKKRKDTIEGRVADSVLERTKQIEIGGVKYDVAPPTVATLMAVSELVAEMPIVNSTTDNVLAEVLATAKDMEVVGRIAATLILGAKYIRESRSSDPTAKRRWWTRSKPKSDAVEELAMRILQEMSAQELMALMTKHLMLLGISDFFALTTSLGEANLLKRTREVETQSGAK